MSASCLQSSIFWYQVLDPVHDEPIYNAANFIQWHSHFHSLKIIVQVRIQMLATTMTNTSYRFRHRLWPAANIGRKSGLNHGIPWSGTFERIWNWVRGERSARNEHLPQTGSRGRARISQVHEYPHWRLWLLQSFGVFGRTCLNACIQSGSEYSAQYWIA